MSEKVRIKPVVVPAPTQPVESDIDADGRPLLVEPKPLPRKDVARRD